jgi:outer membrane protein TolC
MSRPYSSEKKMRFIFLNKIQYILLLGITSSFLLGCAQQALDGRAAIDKPDDLTYSIPDSSLSDQKGHSSNALIVPDDKWSEGVKSPDQSYKELMTSVDTEVENMSTSMDLGEIESTYYTSDEALFSKIISDMKINAKRSFSLIEAIEVGTKHSLDLKNNLTTYDQSLSQLQNSLGQFDINFQGNGSIIRSNSYSSQKNVETDTSTYKMAFTNLFTSGISLEAGTTSNGTGIRPINTETASNENLYYMTLDVPLLKGFGSQNTAAELISSDILAEATLFDVTYQSSVIIGDVVTNYWNYLLNFYLLKASTAAEMNSYKMVTITEQLVANDARPKTALHSLKADWLNKSAQRKINQQDLIEARETLALSLGIPLQMSEDIPIPTTSFPEISETIIPGYLEKQKFIIKDALSRRGDYLASKIRLENLQLLEKQAENALLPDLSVNAGVNQWAGGDVDEYWMISARPTEEWQTGYSVGVSFTVPLQNNAAEGTLKEKKSLRVQGEYTLMQSARQVINGVLTALTNLHLTNEALNNNKDALRQYEKAYQDEQTKYMLGISTPTDIINVADQLNAARETLLNNQSRLANAIIQFNTATGGLVDRDDGTIYFDMQKFLTLQTNI